MYCCERNAISEKPACASHANRRRPAAPLNGRPVSASVEPGAWPTSRIDAPDPPEKIARLAIAWPARADARQRPMRCRRVDSGSAAPMWARILTATLRRMPDAIVVGGGVIGCATAFELARAGADVVLLERDAIGAHASSAAAGMLAPLAESEGDGPLLELGVRAQAELVERLPELVALSGLDPQLSRCGALRVADAEGASELRATAQRLAAFECAWLDPDELYKREPRLAPGLAGALWAPREACLDAALLTRAFAQAAQRRGASLRPGMAVLGLLRDGDRISGVRTSEGALPSAAVILCTGAWAGGSREWLGIDLPVEPVKGQMLALESPVPAPGSILWSDAAYLVPRPDGTLRVGATVERAGFDVQPTAAGIEALLTAARNVQI